MNCSHPVNIPILDCCEEAADLPLYILVVLAQYGWDWYQERNGSHEWSVFLQKRWTYTATPEAQAENFPSFVRNETINPRTGEYSDSGAYPLPFFVDFWGDSGWSLTYLPTPSETITYTLRSNPSARVVLVIEWFSENSVQSLVERATNLMAGRDFTGLSGTQSPYGIEFNRNCKMIDWDGNETITWARFAGRISMYNENLSYQKSAAQFSRDEFPFMARFVSLQKLKALPGEYDEKKYTEALDIIGGPSTPGDLQYSRPITIQGSQVFEPPEFPPITRWNELMTSNCLLTNYICLVPTAP